MLLEPAPGIDIDLCVESFGAPCHIRGLEKDDHDLLRYREILAATRPDLLIETGTNTGVSANWFSTMVNHVITIDIDHAQITEDANANVNRMLADSASNLTVDTVRMLPEFRKARTVMVSLDSDHSKHHVLREIILWAPLVSNECYLVIEDGIFHYRPHPVFTAWDPLAAISEAEPVLRELEFRRDADVEGRFPITGSPAGWWLREEL